MKNVFKILAWIIGASVVVFVGMTTYSNKGFFQTYFNIKQQKLELRTEKSVDSLLNVISEQELFLLNKDRLIEDRDRLLIKVADDCKHQQDSIVAYYVLDRSKLLNIINHQNQMIDNLNKQLFECQNSSGNK